MAIRKASDSNLTGKKYNDASAGATKIEDVPDAPTITGAPTRIHQGATVPFTAPITGGTVSNYTIEASPGNATGTGATSPIQIQGLSAGTEYTFRIRGSSTGGAGLRSSASNAITAANASYVLANTYNSSDTYTVPSGVSEVTVFSFGGGSPGSGNTGGAGGAGAAGILAVSAGQTYSIGVAAASGTSNFGNALSSNAAGNATSRNSGNGGGAGGNGAGGAGGNINKSGITLSYSGGGGGAGNGGYADPGNMWNGFSYAVGGNAGGAGGAPYGAAGGSGGAGYNNCCPHSIGGSPGGTGGTGQARGGGGGAGGNGGSVAGGYGGFVGNGGKGAAGPGGTGQVLVYEYKVV